MQSTTSPARPILQQFAEILLAIPWKHVPADVRAKACVCIADALASALDGVGEAAPTAARNLIAPTTHGSVVWGTSIQTRIQDAAFANAIATHALIEDDIYRKGSIHPGSTVIPAAMAAAESRGSSGPSFLCAVIVGYEVIGRISRLLLGSKSFVSRSFRPTSLFASFGAAGATGVVLGLSPLEFAGALGLAGNVSGGLREWGNEGTSDPQIAVGSGVRGGVTAAELAAAHVTGTLSLLEAPSGFVHAYADGETDPAQILEGLGVDFVISDVTFKAAPSARYVQPAMQLVSRLRAENGLPIETVSRVTVYTSRHNQSIPGADNPGPFQNLVQARMSYQFTVAATLLFGRAGQAEYRLFKDPRLAGLARKVDVRVDPALDAEFERTLATGVRINIRKQDGSEIQGQQNDLISLTAEQVFDKLRQAASRVLPANQVDPLCADIRQLDSLDDVGRLTRRLLVSL